MMIKFYKIHDGAQDIKQAHTGDAGFDICANENIIVYPASRMAVSTGIALDMPDGIYCRVSPRSGLSLKGCIDVAAGVVDPSYQGEVKVVLVNNGERPLDVKQGDRIAQLIFSPYISEVTLGDGSIVESERGINGFGSTG